MSEESSRDRVVQSGSSWADRLRSPTLILVVLGTFLAWGGVVEGADSIVYYVFGIVDGVPNDPLSVIKPIFNPEPMFTFAYRPLSTAVLKLGSIIFGRDTAGLAAFTFVHGRVLIASGLGARRFLMAHGLGSGVSLLGAITAMATPTVLWSAWTLPEYDMVGATFVLWAGAALRQGRLARFIPLAVMAMVTKETSAVLMFAYLLAHSAFVFREDKRVIGLVVGYIVLLLAAVSPTLLVNSPVSHEFYVRNEEFALGRIFWLAVHNSSQLLYSFGPAGALLLWHVLRPRRLGWPLFAGGLLLFAVAPVFRVYNHYEAIVLSDLHWVLLWSACLLAGLCTLCVRGRAGERVLALSVLLGFCALMAGPILASFSRSDLSARLYAPMLPALFGLAWRGAELVVRDRPHLWTRWWRPVGVAVICCFAWQPLAGAFSQWQFWQARFPVERAIKAELVSQLQNEGVPVCCARRGDDCEARDEDGPLVFYPNHNQEMDITELDVLGPVRSEVRQCTSLVQLLRTRVGPGLLWDQDSPLQGVDQFRERVEPGPVAGAMRGWLEMPRGVYLFVQTPRSRMSEADNRELVGDFSWALGNIPEARDGAFEQAMGVIYAEDTPLERTFAGTVRHKVEQEAAYVQLPLWLNEVPRRILRGLPLVERYVYLSSLYTLKKGERPYVLVD